MATIDELLSAARARLDRVGPRRAADLMARGAILVDTRPGRQRAEEGDFDPSAGPVLLIERNHLEWRLDPTSDARLPEAVDHDVAWIVACSEGYSSSLAAASLQPESTVAQRLSRAKAKIRAAGIPFRVPPAHLLPEHVPPVLACVYLVFTEGYSATEGDELVRAELCTEAIRLAETLHELMPDEPEATALLALLVLQHSRHASRTAGGVVGLEEQDRAGWDRAAIASGLDLLRAASRRGGGPYLAQAAIAAAHATAPSFARTDWAVIVRAYDDLLSYGDTPVVRLNRAVAVGFLRGFDAGLAEVAATADHPRLRGSHLLPATEADLLRRTGRPREAADGYRRAIGLAANEQVRAFLRRRLAEVENAAG